MNRIRIEYLPSLGTIRLFFVITVLSCTIGESSSYRLVIIAIDNQKQEWSKLVA